jgi:hypothetical protein
MKSLRDSGKVVGRNASVKQVARQCGFRFPLSVRDFINAPGCPFTSCVHLHIKLWTVPNVPVETMLNRMREIYATAGIRVVVESRQDFSGPLVFTALRDLDVVPQCPRGQTTDEQNVLYSNRDNVRENELAVHFIRSTIPPLNGCAAHPDDIAGVVVTQVASTWTLAHEIGHVLGLAHIDGENQGCPDSNPNCCSTPDNTRLMTGCSTSNIVGTPTISDDEKNALRSSSLTRPC